MSSSVTAQPWKEHGLLEVSANGRYLQYSDGEPFFWQADTAWGIFRNSVRDADMKFNQPYPVEAYFSTRASQGFNVVQAQLLPLTSSKAEVVEGAFALGNEDIDVNAYGHKAFSGGNSHGNFTARIFAEQSTGNIDDYWEYVEYIIDTAAKYGIYMAIVPAWNNHFPEQNTPSVVSDTAVAYDYGNFLGKRFAKKPNIIWVMGGDAHVKKKHISNKPLYEMFVVMNANIAKGIADGKNGVSSQTCKTDYSNTLMTLHPKGGGQSSKHLAVYKKAAWMDFDVIQSSVTHDRLTKKPSKSTYFSVNNDYQSRPKRPCLDIEVSYEYSWRTFGLSEDADNEDTIPITTWEARRSGYLSVFAGAMGYSYGHRNLIHFLRANQTSRYAAEGPWYESLGIDLASKQLRTGSKAGEAANHIQYLKKLMLSRPYFSRIPDQKLIKNEQLGNRYDRLQATRDKQGSFAMLYSSNGRDIEVDIRRLKIKHFNAWWYQPKDGQVYDKNGSLSNATPFMQCVSVKSVGKVVKFTPPGKPSPANVDFDVNELKDNAVGNDWVLVIDDAEKNYAAPGEQLPLEKSNVSNWCAGS